MVATDRRRILETDGVACGSVPEPFPQARAHLSDFRRACGTIRETHRAQAYEKLLRLISRDRS
jgi:hypothetical protein